LLAKLVDSMPVFVVEEVVPNGTHHAGNEKVLSGRVEPAVK
jgi:hypothetical protein